MSYLRQIIEFFFRSIYIYTFSWLQGNNWVCIKDNDTIQDNKRQLNNQNCIFIDSFHLYGIYYIWYIFIYFDRWGLWPIVVILKGYGILSQEIHYLKLWFTIFSMTTNYFRRSISHISLKKNSARNNAQPIRWFIWFLWWFSPTSMFLSLYWAAGESDIWTAVFDLIGDHQLLKTVHSDNYTAEGFDHCSSLYFNLYC